MLTRLQRFLADCGVASRRECEAMIAAGRVSVNGQVRTEMPVMIDPGKDIVTVDDETVGSAPDVLHEQKKVYFLLNKPKGILVTNNDPANRKTVGELMEGIKERVFPVGRLDMDARGALLMTNDGELANRLTHPRYGIEKTYIVEVDGRFGHADLEKIKRGIWLTRGPGAPRPGAHPAGAMKTEHFRVKLIGRERGRTILELKLSEAKNSDIRRVMARVGHVVRDLNRVAIAGKITLKGVDVGSFRPLREDEVKWLYHASSPEFHNRKQAETQQWYETKEMEKERKRLDREDAEPATAPPRRSGTPHGNAAAKQSGTPHGNAAASRAPAKETRLERKRPERKGRKPFVPPTGRNAGKALGGNYIGRRRAQEFDETPRDTQHETSHATPRDSSHPLGDAAGADE